MGIALFPSDQINLSWSNVDDARAYAGLSSEEEMGTLGDVLRMTAAAKVKDGSVERRLTLVEAAQAELVWRLVREESFLQCGNAGNLFTDADPAQVTQQQPGSASASSSGDGGSSCLPSWTRGATRRLEVRLPVKFLLGINSTSQSGAHRRRRRSLQQTIVSRVWHAGQRTEC